MKDGDGQNMQILASRWSPRPVEKLKLKDCGPILAVASQGSPGLFVDGWAKEFDSVANAIAKHVQGYTVKAIYE